LFFQSNPFGSKRIFLDPPYSTIFSLATRPQFRKKGLAHHLLKQELTCIKNRGILNCVVQSSSQGKNLYKKLKFQETKELSTYIFIPRKKEESSLILM